MVRYVTIRKFCELTGYTEKAVRATIHKGDWLQNRVWRKAPDGHVLISLEGFELWVETGMASEKRQAVHTKSPLPFAGFVAAKGSKSSPPPANRGA